MPDTRTPILILSPSLRSLVPSIVAAKGLPSDTKAVWNSSGLLGLDGRGQIAYLYPLRPAIDPNEITHRGFRVQFIKE